MFAGSLGSRFRRERLTGLIVVGAVLTSSWAAWAAPVWCSPFETDDGMPVAHEQALVVVDNRVGAPGVAAGSVSTLTPPVYVPYDGSIPLPNGGTLLPPGLIDPAGAALAFGLSLPDERTTGINTGIRSNVGNLATGLTFEGYFLTPVADPITSPTFVGRRLVTQMRGTPGQSRLAVGLHSARLGVVEGLYDYEGFDYPFPDSPAIDGRAGGLGWNGAWEDTDGDFQVFSNDGVSLSLPGVFPFTPAGSRMTKTGAGEMSRSLSRTLDLSQEGGVIYMSFLAKKSATDKSTGENLEVNFNPGAGSGTQIVRVGMTSDDKFFLVSTASATGTVVAGETYFVVVKVVSHAGNDDAYMSIYDSTETVPVAEPETWDVTAAITGTNSGLIIGGVRIVTGANIVNGEVDELHIGSTYASVTDPAAQMGNPGELKNVLSVFWAEGSDPNVVVNHMELGTTPVEANQWYHFAMTFDGTDLNWYLDGAAQGSVSAAGMVGASAAQMSIGNNRVAGTNDRGFYGVIDEIRLWDRALPVNELAVNGGGPGTGLLWRSRFETDDGHAVSAVAPLELADTFGCIDNIAGAPDGTPAGIVASLYVAYGQAGIPAIPSGPTDIDPGQLAGEYAISLPDIAFVAIDTKLPSNAGDLNSATTVQGYFNAALTVPVSGGPLGSRLVTLMRSENQGNLRLAMGLASNDDVTPTHNVLSLAWADTAGVVAEMKGVTQIVPGTWYHFAMVYDGVDVRWYLNGVQEGELLAPPLAPAGSGEVIIGNDRALAGGRGFYGLMDKIVISDVAIAPNQFMTAALDPCLGKWCNQPFADLDGDTDVDMVDFAAFQRCFAVTTLLEGHPCLCLDRDDDTILTLSDLSEFIKCFTGPGLVWSLGVTPDCTP